MVGAVLEDVLVHVLGLFEVAQMSVNDGEVEVGFGLDFWEVEALLEHLLSELKESKFQVGLAAVQEYSRI